MAVATQILLITTIKDIIRCEFRLTEDESAFISTVSSFFEIMYANRDIIRGGGEAAKVRRLRRL